MDANRSRIVGAADCAIAAANLSRRLRMLGRALKTLEFEFKSITKV